MFWSVYCWSANIYLWADILKQTREAVPFIALTERVQNPILWGAYLFIHGSKTQTLIDVIVFLEKEKINNAVLRYGKDINTILSAF